MTDLLSRFRGMAVSLAVLAISAGVVLAGSPPGAADFGLETAREASGQTVPAAEESSPETEESSPETEESSPETEESSPSPEPTDGPATDGVPDNHGALVSEAARMETPEGFENHGAFVSCVARMNHGHDDGSSPEPIALADLTPEDCAPVDLAEAKAARAEAKAARVEARAARAAERAAVRAERAAARAGG